MELDPHVSVVIPSRLADGRLAETVATVLSQTTTNIEVLVVLPEGVHCNLPEADDPRVRFLNVPFDAVSPARMINAGVKDARARWIAFSEPRCLWSPDHLWSSLACIERSDAEAATSPVLDSPRALTPTVRQLPPRRITTEALLEGARSPMSALVCARASFVDAGGLPEDGRLDAVLALWLRLSVMGTVVEKPTPTSTGVTAEQSPPNDANDALVRHATLVDFLTWLRSHGGAARTGPTTSIGLPVADDPGRFVQV